MINFTYKGSTDFNAKFKSWRKGLESGILPKGLAEKEKTRTEKRIRSDKTDPNGNRWAAWEPTTAQERARRGTASRLELYDSGALLRSISSDGTLSMVARPFLGFNEEIESDAEWIIATIFDDFV